LNGSRYDALDGEEIRRRTGASRVELRGSVGSALDVAHALAAAGAPHGLLVLADEQTAGRGRQGRVWHSPAGGGLWVVALLRPRAAPSAGALAIRVGLRLVEAVEEIAPRAGPRLKWPNDLVVRDRKAGGVLCEARWQGERLGWVAVGIGVNVRGPVVGALKHTAIALKTAAASVTRVRLLEALAPRLWDAAEPAQLTADEREAFLRRQWRPAHPGGGDDDAGALGVDQEGALLVPAADGSLDRRVVPA
jgi:BirA family biotin operon repressor/biotin-[acetyl-CoA-carboxylase] ligase